jgi:hypothetical protein
MQLTNPVQLDWILAFLSKCLVSSGGDNLLFPALKLFYRKVWNVMQYSEDQV